MQTAKSSFRRPEHAVDIFVNYPPLKCLRILKLGLPASQTTAYPGCPDTSYADSTGFRIGLFHPYRVCNVIYTACDIYTRIASSRMLIAAL